MPRNREWYGSDWRQLRSNLIRLCLRHSDGILASSKSMVTDFDVVVGTLVDDVLEDVSRRIKNDRIGLWEKAPPLFINKVRLVEWLEKDKHALSGSKEINGKLLNPRQALGKKLCQYFELARREIIADELGVSSNKIKTWERLDRISRELQREKSVTLRCTKEHFCELARFVKEQYSHDKNLPRTVGSIEAYFYRFSDECHRIVEELDVDIQQTTLENTKDLIQDIDINKLYKCIKNLNIDDQGLINSIFDLGISQSDNRDGQDQVFDTNCVSNGDSKRINRILEQLRSCLESMLRDDLKGTSR